MRASRYAVGDDAFVAKTEQRISGLRTGSIRDQDLILPVIRTDLDTADACVAKHFGMDTADLKQHGRRAGPAKAVAVEVACRLTGQSAREVGMHYGGISGAAVGNIRRKVRDGTIDILPTVERLLSQLRKV